MRRVYIRPAIGVAVMAFFAALAVSGGSIMAYWMLSGEEADVAVIVLWIIITIVTPLSLMFVLWRRSYVLVGETGVRSGRIIPAPITPWGEIDSFDTHRAEVSVITTSREKRSLIHAPTNALVDDRRSVDTAIERFVGILEAERSRQNGA
jgi:hypothetical protein